MAGRWGPSRLRPGRRSPVRSLSSPPASSGAGPPLPATALPLPPAWQGPAGLGGTLGDPQAQLHLPADGMEAGRGGKPAVKATVPLTAWRRGRGGHGGGHGASKSPLTWGGGHTHPLHPPPFVPRPTRGPMSRSRLRRAAAAAQALGVGALRSLAPWRGCEGTSGRRGGGCPWRWGGPPGPHRLEGHPVTPPLPCTAPGGLRGGSAARGLRPPGASTHRPRRGGGIGE